MVVFLLFAAGFIVYLLFKSDRVGKKVEGAPVKWRPILNEKVSFFRSLDDNGKEQFLDDIAGFLGTVSITGVEVQVSLEDRLLVASSAVIPLFGFPHWHYSHLNEVILYPRAFDWNFNYHDPEVFINGMVGDGTMEGKMILSKKALHLGFDNSRDKRNVGIHEFIHLYDKESGSVDGVPPVFRSQSYVLPWLELIKSKIQDIDQGKSDIRGYAATSSREFFAVAGEYFFERPHLFKDKHPDLYQMMTMVFNQNPDKILGRNPKKPLKLGRNSKCPCGSNEKYKHCCLDE